MELVDVLNGRKELTGFTCDREDVPVGQFRLSVHIWIMNDEGKILIQQRAADKKMFPNMWSNTGGATLAGEKSIDTVLRELDEELDITPNIDDLDLIASYQRANDFVDVWLLKENINIDDLTLQKEEVKNVKWVSIDDIDSMLKNGEFVKSSYDYLIKYLKKDY